jgi:hypothetical protein
LLPRSCWIRWGTRIRISTRVPKAAQRIVAGNDPLTDIDEGITELGLGKNMVEALRCWIEAFGIADRGMDGVWALTRIGRFVFHTDDGMDPYFEDVTSAWLLHWLISTNTGSPFFAWECLFNRWPAMEFSASQVIEAFEQEAGLATSPYAYVPCLKDLAFDRPLYLHLAALAALEGQRPHGADALLRDRLRREWSYWRSIHGERVANYDDWSDALAYIIFCQGTDIDQLRRALKTLRVDAPDLAVALQRSYPSADRIAPLEPDLIADALLRERLAERRGSALLDAVIGMGKEQIPLVLPVIVRLTSKTHDSEETQNAAWAKTLFDGLSRIYSRYSDEWVAFARRAEPTQSVELWALSKQLQEIPDVTAVRL